MMNHVGVELWNWK